MKRKTLIIVFLLYVFLSCAATYPVIEKSGGHIYGELSDPVAWIWCLHWTYHALTTDPLSLYDSNRLYPMEHSYITNYEPIPLQIVYAPAYFFSGNQVFATNFTLIATFFLCGFCMYLLVFRYTGIVWVSFCAGCIYAFAPMRLPSEQMHNLASFWMPLALLAVDRYYSEFRLKYLLAGAAFTALQIVTSLETGVMLVCAVMLYFLFGKCRSAFSSRRIWIHHGVSAALFLLLCAPFMYPYYYLQQRYGFQRSLGEVIQFAADPVYSYLEAKKDNRLYSGMNFSKEYDPFPGEERVFRFAVALAGKIAGEEFVASKLGLSRLPGEKLTDKINLRVFHENVNREDLAKPLFQGFVAMLLGFFGLFFPRALPGERSRRLRNIYLAMTVFGFVMSLGPVLILCGHLTYLPMPYLLFYFVPGFSAIRGIYRYAYLVSFGLSVLAGFGLYMLEMKRRSAKARWLRSKAAAFGAGALITAAVLAESWTVPAPVAAIPVGEDIPEVYQWIARNGVDGVMVEIPTVKGTLSKYDPNPRYAANRKMYHDRELEYMYYSTYHFNKMVNGAASFVPKERREVLDALYQLPDSAAYNFLERMNVRTFVLHRERFEPEDEAVWTEENIARMGLAEVFRRDSVAVLKMKNRLK